MHHNPEPASYTVKHKAHNSWLEGIIFMLFTHFLFDINSIFTLSCLLPSFCEVMMLWFKLNPTFLRASMMEEWGIVSQWSSNAQEMKPPKVLTNYKPPLCVVFQRWHKKVTEVGKKTIKCFTTICVDVRTKRNKDNSKEHVRRNKKWVGVM